MPKEKSVISFLLTEEELRLLDSMVIFEPCLIDGVKKARKLKNGKYKVRFSVYDLMESLDALSFAAASVKSYREEKELLSLRSKIEDYLMLSSEFRRMMKERMERKAALERKKNKDFETKD